jgi:hypothetical protein
VYVSLVQRLRRRLPVAALFTNVLQLHIGFALRTWQAGVVARAYSPDSFAALN